MIELTEKEIEALLHATYCMLDNIKSDNLCDGGTFTKQDVKAIERGRVKLAKLLEQIG